MASSLEISSTKNVIKIPAMKHKPPEKSPSPPTTPKSSLQSVLSYADTANPDLLATPKQTLGKKRPREDQNESGRPPHTHPHFSSPSRRASHPPSPTPSPTSSAQPIALNLLLMRHREPTKVAIFDTPMGCRKLPALTS